MKHEIRKVLVLSTEHIPPHVINVYDEYPFITDFEYGAYYYVDIGEVRGVQVVDIPAELKTVLTYARNLGCEEVKFDSDGLVYEDLPVYTWGI